MVFPVTKRVRKAMKLNTVEGAFAVAAENLAAPYLGLFALGLGATPSQIGMLTAFPNLIGNLLQIPAGLWSERMKDCLLYTSHRVDLQRRFHPAQLDHEEPR